MELHPERRAELRHRSFENHGTPRGMFQGHRQTIRRGEGAYGGQIRSRGAVQPGEFLAAQKTPCSITGRERGNPCAQCGQAAAP